MLSKTERQVLSLIDGDKDDVIKYLQTLIGYKTITPSMDGGTDSDDSIRLQEFISGSLREMGFDLETWEVEPSQLERFPGSGVKADRDLRGMPVVAGKREGRGGGVYCTNHSVLDVNKLFTYNKID